ncbi:TIGR03503 family protein [Alishewanella sp. d11]|uniref:TIGR03503 family protein n=1 Tax=Alishewanella sp. d11 TaxID=3414030 RepID=UPI003BF841CE
MARLIRYWFCCLCLLPVAGQADSVEQVAEPGLQMLADLPVANQIPLLDNRFRIDDGIESITMVLFRRPGTASIVLVRPDGSKVFYNTAKQHNMRWHDAATYDLIEITNPMPGPWQAVGRVLPESKILVLTDVELDVDPLPKPLMVGENFKLTARLKDGEQIVNAREFKEILTLQVFFVSTNNKDYDNYGRGMVEAATFRDDGRGYDASARDGVFTGEINLNFGAGEWIPRFSVKTPLYTREVEQETLVIARAAIGLDFVMAAAEQSHHIVNFKPDTSLVDETSLLFQGQVNYPDGDIEMFSLTEPGQPLQFAMQNRGHGSYIFNLNVFGKMLDGREFVLNLPEERFLVTLQAQEAPELAVLPEALAEPEIAAELIEADMAFPWFWVILINLLILISGAVATWFVLTGKSLSSIMFWRKQKAEPSDSVAAPAKTEDKKAQKNTEPDDILDLSLPDD